MDKFKNNPVTINELNEWNKNKLENPRTNRKIKNESRLYNYLNKKYNELNIDDNINHQINIKDFNRKKDKIIKEDILQKLIGPVYHDITLSFDEKDIVSQIDFWILRNE